MHGEMLDIMGQMSDGSLASSLSKAVRDFRTHHPDATEEETRQFLHELRDWAVYTGGASSFIMGVLAAVLGDGRTYPPPCDGDYNRFSEWLEQWTR